MKKFMMIAFITLGSIAFCLSPVLAENYSIKIGGGPTGGTFNTFTNAMAIYLPKVIPDLQASSVGSGGSEEESNVVSAAGKLHEPYCTSLLRCCRGKRAGPGKIRP